MKIRQEVIILESTNWQCTMIQSFPAVLEVESRFAEDIGMNPQFWKRNSADYTDKLVLDYNRGPILDFTVVNDKIFTVSHSDSTICVCFE